MQKSVFTSLYDAFRARLKKLRTSSGLTQRALAKRLGREQNFVARVELGERRLDAVELLWYCKACGIDPVKAATELMRELITLDKHPRRST